MIDQDQRITAYFESLSLPQSRLDQLVGIAQDTATPESGLQRVRTRANALLARLRHPLIRAGLAFAMIAAVAQLMHHSGTVTERAESTFREIAMNHGTRLELEYYGKNLTSLDDSMQQLPFTLVLPDAVSEDVTLIGARYCTLVGNLAAHVKFEDKTSGKPLSLFVTGSTNELKRIQGRSDNLNGVDVELWQEGGLFYALARQG